MDKHARDMDNPREWADVPTEAPAEVRLGS